MLERLAKANPVLERELREGAGADALLKRIFDEPVDAPSKSPRTRRRMPRRFALARALALIAVTAFGVFSPFRGASDSVRWRRRRPR